MRCPCDFYRCPGYWEIFVSWTAFDWHSIYPALKMMPKSETVTHC